MYSDRLELWSWGLALNALYCYVLDKGWGRGSLLCYLSVMFEMRKENLEWQGHFKITSSPYKDTILRGIWGFNPVFRLSLMSVIWVGWIIAILFRLQIIRFVWIFWNRWFNRLLWLQKCRVKIPCIFNRAKTFIYRQDINKTDTFFNCPRLWSWNWNRNLSTQTPA